MKSALLSCLDYEHFEKIANCIIDIFMSVRLETSDRPEASVNDSIQNSPAKWWFPNKLLTIKFHTQFWSHVEPVDGPKYRIIVCDILANYNYKHNSSTKVLTACRRPPSLKFRVEGEG